MTDILSNFNKALNWNEPAVGGGAASVGSTIFVMNQDAKTASADYADPTKLVYGAGAENDSIRPIVVPMGLNLELYLAWYGTAPADDTPVVCIYGEVPAHPSVRDRMWPQDVDANMTYTSADGVAHDDSFWIPLVNYNNFEIQTTASAVDADNGIALFPSGTVAVDSDGADATGLRLSVPRQVYLSGCTRIICSIKTAAANATAAMVLGRFVG